jgi:cytochrome c
MSRAHGARQVAGAKVVSALATAALVVACQSDALANELYEARCGGCHSVAQDRVGPRHLGLANRLAGSVKDFTYSPALVSAGAKDGLRWNAATLERWLTNPEVLVPGQAMGYSLANPQERKVIIDYLLSLP